MSQVDRDAEDRARVLETELSAEDRAWLRERLEEYRELLDYLHDH